MITAVVDANVLASGFVRANPEAAPTQLVELWEAEAYELIVSPHIVAEVEHTFADPYFQRRMGSQQIAGVLTLLQHQATVVPITTQIQGVATHPEDDLVLATAVSARAAYLVTGDIQLQRLGSYEGISPRAFLDVLQSAG